ncbi:MAG: greA [Bacilli bacterium]|nr:greA [Bacilli bacterium]
MFDEPQMTKISDFQQLGQAVNYLKTVKRKEIANSVYAAIRAGDLSQGSAYDIAKTEQQRLEEQIERLEAILRLQYELPADTDTAIVTLGSTVTLMELDRKQQVHYQLVATPAANHFAGEIGIDSPMGKQLAGKSVDARISVQTPAGNLRFKILSVE